MAQVAGELEIRLFAEMARLRADMNKATGIVAASAKNIESAAATATKALGLLGIGISALGFVNLIKGSIDAMDRLNDLSKSTGLTVEQLAGLKVAAKQSGGDLDSIAASINKLSVEMGKAPEKFRALGISAKDPLEAFKQLSDIFVSIDNPQQRAALGAAALGKSWAGAAPLLAEGGKHIGEMVETGTRLSGVTTEMARQADALNDKWVLLTGTGGIMARIVGPLLPLLNEIADSMLKMSDNTVEANASFSPLAETFRTLILFGSDFAFVWRQIGISMVGVKEQVEGFAKSGLKGFTDARAMMTQILEMERAAHDAFQNRIRNAGSGGLGISAPNVPVPGAGAKVAGFLGTGDDAAAKAAREHAKAIRDKMAWLAAGVESQERYNQAILDAIEIGDKEVARIRESALAMSDLIAEQDVLNDADRRATIEKRASDLEALRNSLMTEDELRKFAYQADMDLLNATLGQKKDAQEEYYTLLGRLIRKNSLDQLLIERQKNDAIRGMQIGTWQLGAELLQQFAGESQAAAIAVIAINKGLAIAQVIMNTQVAIARGYAELGPVAGTVNAARMQTLMGIQLGLIAATGLMQAANVGSGGADLGSPANPINTTPGLGSDAGTAGSSGGSGQTVILNLHGETFSKKQVRELVEKVNETMRDGGRIVVT